MVSFLENPISFSTSLPTIHAFPSPILPDSNIDQHCLELAHQWFGNLVTMDWWSELWLNEGFATWVGWLAVDYLHPGHQCWSQFVAEAVQTAFQLDSLRASHPIEVPVKDALEIDQIFDAIR